MSFEVQGHVTLSLYSPMDDDDCLLLFDDDDHADDVDDDGDDDDDADFHQCFNGAG